MGKDRGKDAAPADNYWSTRSACERKTKGKTGDAGVPFRLALCAIVKG